MTSNQVAAVHTKKREAVLADEHLVVFWDFQEPAGEQRVAHGRENYALLEAAKPVERVADGIFGTYAADITHGDWFRIARKDCPALNFYGKQPFTIHVWAKRSLSPIEHCQAMAGMWNETDGNRQYCMFLNLRIWESKDQLCGHVSAEGGPTPGYRYCMSSAIGSTPVSKGEWHLLTFTYDGEYAKVYLDGELDEREGFNPYHYPHGLYQGDENGSDFTVAAVDRSDEPGNFYEGLLAGLAVYDRAMAPAEIRALYETTLGDVISS